MYELLTGNVPFKGDNAVEIALKQMHDPIPSVRKKNPSIPQSVENIILKSTAKNPKNRYADAKEMHADLLTALNEDKINEDRLIFKYPEHDPDEKIVLKKKTEDTKKEEKPDKKEEVVATKLEEDKSIKRSNRVIWILMSIFASIVLLGVILLVLVPNLTKIPDIKVPNVANLTVIEAEEKLKDVGFEVSVETIKEVSSEVEKGDVIKTSPAAGRSIKKGTTITIYESVGEEVYEMENFVGENYIEIQAILENVHKLKVTIEKKDVEDVTMYDEQEIIEQDKPEGTKLAEGDEVILYIPDIVEGYPDFVEDGWSETEAQDFCDKYGVTLKITYEETLQYTEGMIISQSRTPDSPIVKGATLKITVAKSPSVAPEEGEPSENDPLSDIIPQP